MDGSQPLIMVAILSRKWPFYKVKQANGTEILSVPSLSKHKNQFSSAAAKSKKKTLTSTIPRLASVADG